MKTSCCIIFLHIKWLGSLTCTIPFNHCLTIYTEKNVHILFPTFLHWIQMKYMHMSYQYAVDVISLKVSCRSL